MSGGFSGSKNSGLSQSQIHRSKTVEPDKDLLEGANTEDKMKWTLDRNLQGRAGLLLDTNKPIDEKSNDDDSSWESEEYDAEVAKEDSGKLY